MFYLYKNIKYLAKCYGIKNLQMELKISYSVYLISYFSDSGILAAFDKELLNGE